jgi:cyclopropane fatty-acyl-phospholipid synthase-like methyltransferase
MALSAKPEKEWESTDKGFETFLRDHPDATYAEYYAHHMRQRVDRGTVHTTLGGNLKTAGNERIEFAESGRKKFAALRKIMQLEPRHRLIDYGCGSFRIGLHAMNFLDPGHYFGLDITTDFIDMGKDLVGAETLAARRPRAAAIAPESLAEAEAFQADAVISIAVAIHVHPDETQTYYGNLQRLASKPGASLLFTADVADKFERTGRMRFAWPLQFYKDQLPEMEFVNAQGDRLLFRRR